MPLKIAFQNINGKKFKEIVPPYEALLERLLPFGDSSFPLLGWIDCYSNTIFNSNQMYPLIAELDQLELTTNTEASQKLIAQIRELAIECRDKPQTYLRFIGD